MKTEGWAFHDVTKGMAHFYVDGHAMCGMRNRTWHDKSGDEASGVVVVDDKKCRKCRAKSRPTPYAAGERAGKKRANVCALFILGRPAPDEIDDDGDA